MGKEISYGVAKLSSDQVAECTSRATFKQFNIDRVHDPRYKDFFTLAAAVPLESKTNPEMSQSSTGNVRQGSTIYVRVDQWKDGMLVSQTNGRKTTNAYHINTFYTFYLSKCENLECKARIRFARVMATPDEASMDIFPEGIAISSVLYGDANGDGLNDFLLRLSDGSGLLMTVTPAQAEKK